MKKSSEGIQMLLAKAKASINKTPEIQQFLAKNEANLSRQEN